MLNTHTLTHSNTLTHTHLQTVSGGENVFSVPNGSAASHTAQILDSFALEQRRHKRPRALRTLNAVDDAGVTTSSRVW